MKFYTNDFVEFVGIDSKHFQASHIIALFLIININQSIAAFFLVFFKGRMKFQESLLIRSFPDYHHLFNAKAV